MEGNLPSNKNQELNIRQSFLHLNNSNSKACVKIFFWKYLTALSTSNYKKCNIYHLNKTTWTYFLYEQKLCLKMFVDFIVPTKHEDITVITFRFFRYCRRILSYWNGTQLWNIIRNCWSFLNVSIYNHEYARPLCIFSAYIYYCIYQSCR